MPQKVLQPSFSGGVFSPSLYSRVDLQKYSTGLRTAKNFFVHPHGGASNRQGTEYITAAKYADKKCRLVPFEFSLEQAYVLEFGEGYARVFKDGGIIPLPASSSDYNPSSAYAVDSDVVVGDYYVADFGDNRKLYIIMPKGCTAPSPIPEFRFRFKTSTDDTLRVGDVGNFTTYYGADIRLANATPSKNSADNIQNLIRTGFLEVYGWSSVMVAASAEYIASPAIASTMDFIAPTDCEVTFRCLSAQSSSTNAGAFPPVSSDWTTDMRAATPYLEADLPLLKFAQSADVLYITHPNYAPRMLVRYAEDDWALETYDFQNGPFMPVNTDEANTITPSALTGTVTLTAIKDTFDTSATSLHIGALWKIVHEMEGQKVTTSFTSVTAGTSIKCGKTWRLITRGNWGGTVQVEKSTDGGTTWKLIRAFSSTYSSSIGDFNANTYGDVDEPCLVRMNCTAYSGGTCGADLTADGYDHVGIVKITGVTSSKVATATVIEDLGAITATWDWSEGSWSNYRGWPRAVTFFQDRLVFAGTDSEPQTVWMTKTSNYVDFGRTDPIVDSDGISINLPARKMNGIKSMTVLSDLMPMTTATEWSIGSGSGAAVTPTSIQVNCQGYGGCSDVDPVIVGNRILYFQPFGAILRDMGYTLDSNGYSSDDISVMASHFFDGHSIVDMAFQQEPDRLLWCVREDGTLLSLTYMREQEVFAWCEHNTEGYFESVCSIPGDGYNEVWFVVKRTINGATVRYIERLVQRMVSTEPEDQIFMDSAKTYSGAAATVITGLDHLEGEVVAVLADGGVVAGKTVTGGQITLDTAAAKVHVGLPYTCDLETLNVELNLNTGTTQGSKVKVSDVTVRFLNSRGGKIAPNSTATMDDVIMDDGTDITGVEPLHSIDHKQVLSGGYDEGGRVFFRQSDPLPTTILAVIPNVAVGG